MMQIRWSLEARLSYENIIDDLITLWNIDVAESFESK